jgi:hypothetical protein
MRTVPQHFQAVEGAGAGEGRLAAPDGVLDAFSLRPFVRQPRRVYGLSLPLPGAKGTTTTLRKSGDASGVLAG